MALPVDVLASERNSQATTPQIIVNSLKIDQNPQLYRAHEESQPKVVVIKKKAVVYALKYGGKLLGSIFELIGDKRVASLLKQNSYAIGEFWTPYRILLKRG